MDEWLASNHSTPSAATPGPKKLPYENEQYLMNEEPQLLEKNMPAFDLDQIDFMMADELNASSRAFPPSAYPENTPALLPNGQNQANFQNQPMHFQSPLLPGQNEKSYNEEHLYHRRQQVQRQSFSQNSSGVRPDAVFTPLVSPAVTPMESQINTNKNQNVSMQATFEPLTSPALNAQQRDRPADRRRPSSATFPEEYNGNGSSKRRTPHSTPNLAASKPKRSPSLRKTPQNPVFEQLPDSSYEVSGENHAQSSETTPMLPPNKRGTYEGSSGGSTPYKTQSQPGPATLMGFTMNRLAESQSTNNSSPSLAPQNGHHDDSMSTRSSISGHRTSVKQETSSSEPSPAIEPQNGEEGTRRREKGPGKKASHKIAEQGRRNRMNQAVHELAGLIPKSYHDEVSIPSKATTIELASRYIQTLSAELEELRARLPPDENRKDKKRR